MCAIKYVPVLAKVFVLLLYLIAMLSNRQDAAWEDSRKYKNLVQYSPEQTPAPWSMVAYGDYNLAIKANYKIAARVLQMERYYIDWMSGVSPVDLFLGWGDMSNVDLVKNSLGYIYQWDHAASLNVKKGGSSKDGVSFAVGNVHIIPLNNNIKRYLLEKVKRYDLIYMEGNLVDVLDGNNKLIAKTALVRGEQAPGGCEIMLVRKIYHLRD
jgi:hypothetical protein